MKSRRVALWFLTYAFVPLACAFASLGLGLDTNWDVRNYHLYNAWARIHERQLFDLAPAGLQTWLSPLFDLAWFALVTSMPPAVGGFLLGLLHGLNFLAVRAIALRVLAGIDHAPNAAWLLAAAAMISPGFLSELGNAMHDNVVALLILGALALALNSLDRPVTERLRPLAAAGALAGFACAGKLTSAVYATALGLALLSVSLYRERDWRSRLHPVAAYCGALVPTFFVAGGWWYWLNWTQFGNPLFPMLNHFFEGALADPLSHRDTRFLPEGASAWVLRPILMCLNPYLASELPYRPLGLALAFLVGLSVLALRSYRRLRGHSDPPPRPETVLLGIFALSGYALWLSLFGIYRYLIPIELLIPPILALMCVTLLNRRRGLAVGIVLVVALASCNLLNTPDWGRAPWAARYYSLELPSDSRSVDAVLLMGQPLGWLVPAFDLPVPFLQIHPNFEWQSSRYGAELRSRLDGTRQVRVVYDPEVHRFDDVSSQLALVGRSASEDECGPLHAFLGGRRFTYRYCPVR